jgi:hypothetical protein
MILHPQARPYTAFTVPGMGQFQWVTSPMGLLGCPASFQRLMETVVDASLGDDKKPGGLGAILTQLDSLGQHCVIAYASRKLQKHECNYTPFLLEMQAAIWGMDHFTTYLRGRKFTLITDHRPLEKLGKVHTKTLNHLQEIMNTFDFDIVYKKVVKCPLTISPAI